MDMKLTLAISVFLVVFNYSAFANSSNKNANNELDKCLAEARSNIGNNLSAAVYLPFTGETIPRRDLEKLVVSSYCSKDAEELLERISLEFEDLKILVSSGELSGYDWVNGKPSVWNWLSKKINFTDHSISDSYRDSLLLYVRESFSPNGYAGEFIFPGQEISVNSSSQEDSSFFAEQPTLIIANNVPKETIVHEVLHFLIWKVRNARQQYLLGDTRISWTERDFKSRTGFDIPESYNYYIASLLFVHWPADMNEHIDISAILLKYSHFFKFSESEMTRTKDLLKENYLGQHGVRAYPFWDERRFDEEIEFAKVSDPAFKALIRKEIKRITAEFLFLNQEFNLGFDTPE